MEHASDIITVDVYGDNDEIIADCVEELETFIESVCTNKQVIECNVEDELDVSIDEDILQELVAF